MKKLTTKQTLIRNKSKRFRHIQAYMKSLEYFVRTNKKYLLEGVPKGEFDDLYFGRKR